MHSSFTHGCRLGLLAVLLNGLVAHAVPVAAVRLIGVQTLPPGLPVEGTTVGGLSGIDYDAVHDRWLAISDDRSEHGPARAYALRLDYDGGRFTSATVDSTITLRQPDGRTYPNRKEQSQRGGEIADCEAIRIDPIDGSFWYSSEGDYSLGMQPFVRHAASDGRFLDELSLSRRFRFSPNDSTGPRPNLVFEGLSFSPDGRSLWVAMEAPLWEDGPVASIEHGAVVRFSLYRRDGQLLSQLAYPIDAVPVKPAVGKLCDNGVSEVLAVGEQELLVLERAGIQDADGGFHFHERLYLASTDGATDVRAISGLVGKGVQAMSKRLLVDFDKLRREDVDNLEGLSWGRRLSNGHETLVLVSDDNFNAKQSTQLWVFEILPAESAAAKPSPRWDSWFEDVVQDETRIAGFVGEYRWLSNYYECPVTYEGRTYGSSEAAYHASKFPEAERDEFTKLDPDASKKLSRRKSLDQAWWDARKERVMGEIVRSKFSQNPELAAKLLATGERQLEERNWWGDKFWGTVKGDGKNVLGGILTELRTELRAKRQP